MYSKEKVLDLLNTLLEDIKDSEQDYFDSPSAFNQHAPFVRKGYNRSKSVVESYIKIVVEEW